MASPKQIAANLANSQLSCGPVTPEGKATCSHNALKTGLTGQTVLLPTDNIEAYQQLVARFHKRWTPVGEQESEIVQSLADTEWRILRIPGLEASVLAVGRYELAGLFAEVQDAAARAALIEGRVLLTYRRDLSNLALQETRLCRRRDKESAELKTLQSTRKAGYDERINRACNYFLQALVEHWGINLADFGSDFSLEDVIERTALLNAKADRDLYPEVTRHQRFRDLKKKYEQHCLAMKECQPAA